MAAHNDVFPAISIQVGNGDGFCLIFCGSGQPDLGGNVTKFPARQALVEGAAVDVDDEDVQNAVSVEIEEIDTAGIGFEVSLVFRPPVVVKPLGVDSAGGGHIAE